MATKTETKIDELKINYLSESDYNTALSNGELNENEIYMTPISNSGISDATTSTNGLLSYSSNVATTSEIKTYLGY